MCERKLCGVEKEAVELIDRFLYFMVCDGVVASLVVSRVADDRVIYRREMHTDLMCPTRLDLDVDESKLLKPLPHSPDRQGAATIRRDRHLRAMPSIACDRSIDSP